MKQHHQDISEARNSKAFASQQKRPKRPREVMKLQGLQLPGIGEHYPLFAYDFLQFQIVLVRDWVQFCCYGRGNCHFSLETSHESYLLLMSSTKHQPLRIQRRSCQVECPCLWISIFFRPQGNFHRDLFSFKSDLFGSKKKALQPVNNTLKCTMPQQTPKLQA